MELNDSGKPLRVGIVDGNPDRGWARDAHIPALRSLPGVSIAAVSARTGEIAQAAPSAAVLSWSDDRPGSQDVL